MPRNDRWRPSQVHRMVTPEMRAEAQRREQERADQNAARFAGLSAARASVGRARERRRSSYVNGGAIGVVYCRHGVPWTTCTLCSKPAAP